MLQLDYLSDSNFLGVNRLFILPFDFSNSRIGYLKFYLPIEKVGDYNVMIDEKNVFDQPIKNYIKKYDNILENYNLPRRCLRN